MGSCDTGNIRATPSLSPTITKLAWTFWNQDKSARTGTYQCADSWYETTFPVSRFPLARAGHVQPTTQRSAPGDQLVSRQLDAPGAGRAPKDQVLPACATSFPAWYAETLQSAPPSQA